MRVCKLLITLGIARVFEANQAKQNQNKTHKKKQAKKTRPNEDERVAMWPSATVVRGHTHSRLALQVS